jgi:uncharacterized repeat protein (TIGR02543 family)
MNLPETFTISGVSEISNNTAEEDGGGIHVGGTLGGSNGNLYDPASPVAHYEKLTIGPNVVFSGNKACEARKRLPVNDAAYASSISCTKWSESLSQGYNNYDINQNGIKLKIFDKKYDGNGHTSGAVPVDTAGNALLPTKSYTYLEDTIAKVLPAGNLAKSGHTFTGWNTAADGSGTSYAANSSIIITADIVLYAQWKSSAYIVNFIDWDGAVLKEHKDIVHGGNAIAPANPSRSGYEFTGWDKAFSNITGNLTVTALYSEIQTPPIVNPPPVNPPPVNPPPVNPPPVNPPPVKPPIVKPPVIPPPLIIDPVDPDPEESPPIVPATVEPPPAAVDPPAPPPVVNEVEIDPLPIVQESPHQAALGQLADAGVPIMTIGGQEVPLVAFPGVAAWALLNVVCAALGAVFVFITLLRVRAQKKLEEDEFEYRGEHEGKQSLRRHVWVIPAIILAVFGIIFFMITEDTNSLMVLLWDQWTIFNVAAFVGVIITTKKALENKGDYKEDLALDVDAKSYFAPADNRV